MEERGGYMTKEEFIKEVAKYVQKYAPKYGLLCNSGIIAQACLESSYGTSNKAKYHNYFGLKYRKNRVTCNNGYFYDGGSEQNKDGSYTLLPSDTAWYAFDSMEKGIEGYCQFVNVSNYNSIKGITDPYTYLKNIKSCGYATSQKYVDNVYSVVKKWNLTQYDTLPITKDDNENNNKNDDGGKKMIINIHSGHNPDGKKACGAIGLIRESTEARKVKDAVIKMLKLQGHTVHDCTVNNGTSQKDILKKIVARCNANVVDLDVSIHFNAGANKILNKVTTGTEVYVYSPNSKAKEAAQKIVNNLSALGFKNRGVKYSKSLYFLKHTNSPSLLIEVCFVDDPDDVNVYNVDNVAQAIVTGITGTIPVITTKTETTTVLPLSKEFKVKVKSSSLNIRAGASATYKKVGCIKDKGIYTIIDTKGNWGLLKSKKGWINISSLYVQKV